MIFKLYKVLLLAGTFVLVGCSSSLKKTNLAIKNSYQQKKYDESLGILEKSDLKKEKKNKLLYLLYKGKIKFSQGKFAQSARIFEETIEIVDREFEKGSEKFYLSSESKSPYYGEFHEISHMFHYQALSFLFLARETKDLRKKNTYLQSARSVLKKWNSFNEALAREFPKQITKLDLLNKIIAANIHEQLGSRSDLSIALQLYIDSINYFSLLGPTVKRYNHNFDEYNQKLYELADDNKLNIQEFIKDNESKNKNQAFVDFRNQLLKKVLTLSYRSFPRRKREISKLCEQYNKKLVADFKEKKIKANPSSKLVTVIFEQGTISEKEKEEFHIGLRGAIDLIEDEGTRRVVRGIGVPILTYFALGPLGLGSYSRSGTTQIYVSHNVGTTLVEEVGFEFSLPKIESTPLRPLEVQALGTGPITSELDLNLSHSDLLQQNILEKNRRLYWTRAKRIGIKYILAIIAAYGTYQSLNKNNNDGGGAGFLAKAAALTTFLAMTKTIKHLEEADLRSWVLLPQQTKVVQFHLDPGKQFLKYKVGKKQFKELEINVSQNSPNIFYISSHEPPAKPVVAQSN